MAVGAGVVSAGAFPGGLQIPSQAREQIQLTDYWDHQVLRQEAVAALQNKLGLVT
jgi:hypothetical protein